MKTRLNCIFFLFVLFAAELFGTGFRGYEWGTPLGEVKSAEDMKLYLDLPNILGYSGKVAGVSSIVSYDFTDGRLVSGMISPREKFPTPTEYLRLFERLTGLLTEKYGEPLRHEDWLDDLFRNTPEEYGFAVKQGHLRITCKWDLGETLIKAYLYSSDNEPSMYIYYADKAASQEKEKAIRERYLDDL